MTLLAKVAHPHAGISWHCQQKWHTHTLAYHDTVGKSGTTTDCSQSFPFYIFIRYKYILYWCLHFCTSQPPRQNCVLHVCQVHSYLCADSLTRTNYMRVFAWIWPLMCRLLVSELVSGDASLQIDAVTENIQCQNVFLYYSCNLHGSFCTAGIRGFQTLSPTSFLTLDSKPHLLPLIGL